MNNSNTLGNECCPDETFGAEPTSITWKVVRGDTASIRINFFENDEKTYKDTSSWSFVSTAYDPKTQEHYDLDVDPGAGYVNIIATPATSSQWGTGYNENSAELKFDLQVTIDSNTVWTPIIGRIVVISDIGGTFLS